MNALTIVLIVVGISAGTFLVWRLASHRHALPCPTWLSWLVELDNPLARTNRASFIVDHIELQAGMTVLDAGCGPGRLTLPVARAVGVEGRVLAVDVQQGMLDKTLHKVTQEGLENVDFLLARLGEGMLPSANFDRALLVAVLGEIPARQQAVSEIYSALKPGGLLAVAELIFDPHYQSRKSVIGICTKVGFREKRFFGNRLAYLLLLEKPADR